MKYYAWMGCVLSAALVTSTFAAEQVVKEETTPPSAEGPLSVNQIPSLNSLDKPVAAAPAAPAPAGTNNSQATEENVAPQPTQPITQPQQPQETKPMTQADRDAEDNDGLIT